MPRDRATASVRRQLGPASASASLVGLEPSLHVEPGRWRECSMNRLERIAYDLGQAARVAWFYGHARLRIGPMPYVNSGPGRWPSLLWALASLG
jgi:hypothetical protein